MIYKKVLFILIIILYTSITQSQEGNSYYINNKLTAGQTADSGINCSGGEIHDDGSFEGGVGWASVTTDGRFVSKFTPVHYPWKYDKFCLALGKYWVLTNSDMMFDIVVYDTASDGKPGNLVWHLDSLFVTGIPNVPTYQFYSFSNLNIPVLNSGSYYIGIKYNPSQNNYQKYSGCDLNGSTYWPGYYWSNFQPYWTPIEQGFPIGFKALSYRMEGSELLSINSRDKNIPDDYYLSQNYPNPFNPSTIIEYFIPDNEHVILKVYDALGNEVKVLVNDWKGRGYYYAEFEAAELSSGLYFYTMESGTFREVKRMIVIK